MQNEKDQKNLFETGDWDSISVPSLPDLQRLISIQENGSDPILDIQQQLSQFLANQKSVVLLQQSLEEERKQSALLE